MTSAAEDSMANMGDDFEELDQISRVALLIDDINNEDPQAQLNSIQKLSMIASTLGVYRCVDELIPMLTELIDKIDSNSELMVNLAEQFGELGKLFDSDSSLCALLKPLELISSSDD